MSENEEKYNIKVNCTAWKTENCEIKILQELYTNEVNFQIRCFWDEGFSVGLGDEMNGFTWEGTFETLLEALRALINHVSVTCEES